MTTTPVRLRLSRLHYPVTVLGPGRRAGIWFQGCGIHCDGCMSLDTWPDRPERTVPVRAVLAWLSDLTVRGVDGVTISGGEPTEQPEALRALIAGVHEWRSTLRGQPRPDILVFSGREPDWLNEPDATMLDGADAAVMGPFVANEAGSMPLRGSDNQQLVTLTDLGRERYAPDRLPARGGLQATTADDQLWLIGIPLPGQLAYVEARLAERGIRLGRPSWKR